jgi:hypothetical protein
VQGFECSGIFPFNRNRIPDEKFLPSEIFSSLTDTNDEFGPSEKGECSVEKSAHSTSLPSCGKDQLQNSKRKNIADKLGIRETRKESFRSIIPSPKKTVRNTSRKRNFVTHLTSPEHMKKAKQSQEQKQKPVTKLSEKRNNKPQESETSSDTDSTSSESDGDTLCGFCGIAHRSPLSTLKGDWIQCQQCRIWYHEKCVGAGRRKMFTRGKCN